MFDPAAIPDDACVDGHLDSAPVYQVLLALGQKLTTGRLTIADAAGDNHMYFMQGRPVGVHLAEHFHPLGQLLLELGRMSGGTFVRAQRLIAEGNRLPGQVYKELGILDDPLLKEVLAIQARRKAEHFCRLGSRPFKFCRGLTYLTGFTSTPLDAHGVIFLAVRQQMGEQAREAWYEAARLEQVRLVPPGPYDNAGLPAPLAQFGFGAPEERFLQRLLAGFESVGELADTGTLPRDEMAVLLRYLEVVGRLRRRPIPSAPPPVLAKLGTDAPTPVTPAMIPAAAPAAVPAQVTAMRPHPGMAELQNLPLNEPTSEEVFSRPRPGAPIVAADDEPLFAGPSDVTDPRRPAVTAVPASATPSIVVSEELPLPVAKKKKVKRTEALPSESSGVLISETRREKTEISNLPTIVINDDD
ncbi:MAG: hypothetical protein Q8O67_10495 [Deltaproteobacteria bacterium]|nr:hypothetical protein [Deltaproteobacteria bacterium]